MPDLAEKEAITREIKNLTEILKARSPIYWRLKEELDRTGNDIMCLLKRKWALEEQLLGVRVIPPGISGIATPKPKSTKLPNPEKLTPQEASKLLQELRKAMK